MVVISPDESQLKKEEDILKKKQKEDDERANYLEVLRNSRKFQKYVVKEIFENVLNDIYTLDKLPISDNPQAVGNIAIQYALSRQAVKQIIDKLK